jgi:hypothetical protein
MDSTKVNQVQSEACFFIHIIFSLHCQNYSIFDLGLCVVHNSGAALVVVRARGTSRNHHQNATCSTTVAAELREIIQISLSHILRDFKGL